MINTKNIDARSIERAFKRQMEKKGWFTTANGTTNTIVSYTGQYIVINSSKSTKPLSISRERLRKAISFTYFKRTIIRKDMEKYSKFHSAIFGMMFAIFRDKAKLQKLKKGFRITLKGLRYFFGGCEQAPADMELVSKQGGKFLLLSHHYLRKQRRENWLGHLERLDLYAVIDSGAFSEYTKGKKKKANEQLTLFKEDPIEEYARAINQLKNHPRIIGFFPLDVIGDPAATKINYDKLVQITKGAKIYPVWQISDTYEALEQLVSEEHELIGIGGTVPLLKTNRVNEVRSIFKKVFESHPTQPFHWLGGANEMLCEFAFYSSDSIAWLNPRKNDEMKIYDESGKRRFTNDLSMLEIMQHNICFLLGLEHNYEKQLTLGGV
ncbi:hypothetical protein AWH56_009010 [Anaerobacillus isosaccharinicus]|uniref:Uncharacterized protein n=1 Tax=Anaerobacillus isosaccharinicus TaxID=1532552 RepID=A0A1S2M8P3_9BACI|nr:hypothetical protein [Anaerobacillus isosaccharinicus]MBA5588891.1 hypothetical protein [Anaerobacillus isosaccharinicus]QOY37701.1 hypothetical protein AWH56_009010 [Anaerobacillus isosaccharinicus]